MVRVSSPAKLRPWSELTAKIVMGVVPGLVTNVYFWGDNVYFWEIRFIFLGFSKILFFGIFSVAGGFWDSMGWGGPCRGFRKYLTQAACSRFLHSAMVCVG